MGSLVCDVVCPIGLAVLFSLYGCFECMDYVWVIGLRISDLCGCVYLLFLRLRVDLLVLEFCFALSKCFVIWVSV